MNIADFKAEKENNISSIGKETTKFFEQKPVLNGYYIVSELNDVSKSG